MSYPTPVILVSRKSLLAVAAALAVTTYASAARAEEAFVPVRSWDREVLGPNSQAWTAVQGPDGALYVGADGVMRFDGERWRRLAVSGGASVRALDFGRDGRLWVAANGQIGYFDSGAGGWSEFHELSTSTPAGTAIGDMWHVFAEADGAVFISQSQVLRIHAGRWTKWDFPGARRLPASTVKGEIWFHHSPSGLWALGPQGPELRIPAARLPAITSLIQVVTAADGHLILVSYEGLFRAAANGFAKWSPRASEFAWQHNPTSACTLPDGRIVIGSLTGGLAFVSRDGETVTVVDRTDGLPSQSVLNVSIGRNQEIWCAMPTHVGLLDSAFTMKLWRDARVPLAGANAITAAKGDLWLATNEGLFRFRRSEFQRTASGYYFDVLPMADGVLASSPGSVEGVRDEKVLRLFHGQEDISHLAEMPGGATYLASQPLKISELVPGDNDSWSVRRIASLPDLAVSFVWENRASIWVSTAAGNVLHLRRVESEPWQVQPISLPGSGTPRATRVTRVGNQIAAVSDAGGFCLDPATNSFVPIPGMPALPVQALSRPDDAGRVWVAQRSPFTDGDRPTIVGSLTASSQGTVWKIREIVSSEHLGEVRLIAADPLNHIWLAGTKSLARLSGPLQAPSPPAHPPIIATEIAREAKVPFHRQSLRFEFSAGEFLRRDKLRFQTRLIGLDADWSEPTNESHLAFPGLREDRYELQVRTVDALGQSSPTATWQFSVLPPWYRTGWALAGSMLAMGGVIVAGMHLRQRVLIRRTRELEAAVAAKTAALERANAAQSEFIANMSHELRHPISGIVGGAIALEDSAITLDQQESVRSIRHCATLLHHIVSDVLDLAKIEAGELTLEETSFMPAELMQNCVQMMQSAAGKANCDLTLRLSLAASRRVRGDPGRIQQILMNLLSNAFKFAPNSEVEISVSEQPGAWLRYAVRDHGPGIAPEDQSMLFKRFTRLTRKRGSVQGAGLGLALCREIAVRMNGRMGVESSGAGSTFFVELPLIESEVAPKTCPPSLSGLHRALVVDDIDYAAAATAAVARHLGFDATIAHNGPEALDAFSRLAFDLVLIDWDLDGQSGVEVMRAMRQRTAATHRVRFVAATAHAAAENRQTALGAGFDGFITKPVTPEKLAEVIEPNLRATRPAPPAAICLPPEVLDLRQLRLLADDDPMELTRQIGRLREQIETNLVTLREAVEGRIPQGLSHAAHRLANDGRMIGATELVSAAETVQKLAALEGDHELESALVLLVKEGRQICALLEAERARHPVSGPPSPISP